MHGALVMALIGMTAWADPAPIAPSPPPEVQAPAAPTAPTAPPAAPAAAPAPSLAPPVVPRPMAPEFACEGTSGRTRRLSHYLGRAVIIVYEDRDSNQQNDVLKQELAARARAQDLSQDVSVVPVANLSGFAFWPAQGFARDAVLDIARQQQMEILIDWSGDMARAYRFRPAMSYVMVLSREGRVLFRHAGTLDASARGRFFNAVSESIATR
jgi:predicted transcriptional regulator